MTSANSPRLGTLRREEHGSGPEHILLIHGFISSPRWWQHMTAQLVPERIHAHAVELRAAAGQEGAPSDFTVERAAEDLAAYVAWRNMSKCVVVGHSLGAAVATRFALSYPQAVRGLVLISPLPQDGVPLPEPAQQWMLMQQGEPAGLRQLLHGVFAVAPEAQLMETLTQDAAQWTRAAFATSIDEMTKFRARGRLAELSAPALIVAGDRDTQVPVAAAVETWGSLPHAGLEVWHGVGHSPHVEAPERFGALLMRFLDELAPVVTQK